MKILGYNDKITFKKQIIIYIIQLKCKIMLSQSLMCYNNDKSYNYYGIKHNIIFTKLIKNNIVSVLFTNIIQIINIFVE